MLLVMVHSQRKVEVQHYDKRSSFPGVTDRIFIFCRHFNQFPPQGGNRIDHHCSCILMRVQQFLTNHFEDVDFYADNYPIIPTQSIVKEM